MTIFATESCVTVITIDKVHEMTVVADNKHKEQSNLPEFAPLSERIERAAGEVLARFPGDDFSRMLVDRYVDRIKTALSEGLPVDPAIVSGNNNLAALADAVAEVNSIRGYTPEKVDCYLAEQVRLQELSRQSSAKLRDVVRYWGGWKGIPGDLQEVFYRIQDGIDSGDLPALADVEIDRLGGALPAGLRKQLEELYSDAGRLLSIPEATRTSSTREDQVSRYFEQLSHTGIELDPLTARVIGSGSEGTVFYVKAFDNREFALKIKHAADVIRTEESAMLVAAISSQSPPFAVAAVEIFFEDDQVVLMQYHSAAPDLQDLHNFLYSKTDPEGEQQALALAEFIHRYRESVPTDTDLSQLQDQTLQAARVLVEMEHDLRGSATWSDYFCRTENPLSIIPRNFLVTGASEGSLALTCIDAR